MIPLGGTFAVGEHVIARWQGAAMYPGTIKSRTRRDLSVSSRPTSFYGGSGARQAVCLVPQIMHASAIVGSLVGGAVVLAWRVRETQTPVTAAKLLVPPFAMSTGFFMFLAPQMRVPWTWALCAFAAGALLFAYPLIHTSTMVRQGDVILMRRSKAFVFILVGLLAVRLALREYVEQYVSMTQTAALFFILAFGMLLPWRVAMFASYRVLRRAGAMSSA